MFLPNPNSFLLVKSVSKQVTQSGFFGIQESKTNLSRHKVGIPTSPSGSSPSYSRKKMFLPNSYSFLSVQSVLEPTIQSSIQESVQNSDVPMLQIRDPDSHIGTSGPPSSNFGRKMFLPNSNSFSLMRSEISNLVIQSDIPESVPSESPSSDSGEQTIVNKDKRTFLKVAGIAGAGIAGSLLLPKKAEALIMGSSPTTGVVGVKDATNARINPATEETVSTLATEATVSTLATEATVSTLLKPTDLDFDGSGYLNVNLASPITTATETTLETIAFGGKKYALKMTTVGDIDYIAEADTGTPEATAEWRVKKVDSTSGIVITWADGNSNFDNAATNLPGLSYS